MNNKPRKIVGISEDEDNLHVDIRVTIPKTNCSPEFVKDIIDRKDDFINGVDKDNYRIEFTLFVEDSIDGEERLVFERWAI